RDCYAHIGGSVSTIRLAGGGARSPFWSQMIADVTGLSVEIPEGSQFGAKGAALCAATAIGRFSSIGEACAATFRSKRTHDPDTSQGAAYAAGFRRFKTASAAALDALA
ncbi:FGGY-family carbohydrate kinase, partial [Rhizobiaceae sp. 2RAB30]